MEQNEKRSTPRFPVGERENITIKFNYKDQSYRGSLWDYSRFGLGIYLEDVPEPPHKNTHVEDIRILAFGEECKLGEGNVARLINESGSFYAGLILTNEFIDLDSLIKNKTFRLQNDEIREIQSLLEIHRDLDETFKLYASDFAAGLSVFKQDLDALDARTSSETPSMKKNLFRVMEQGIGKEMLSFIDQKVSELDAQMGRLNGNKEKAGHYLRNILWPYLDQAPFLIRTIEKPRGYAGDSMMMEMVYENGYRGKSTFGKFFHNHPLRIPSADAVRNRRGLICNTLNTFIEESGKEKINVLSVACGPAREMKDFLETSPYKDRINLYLLDQDPEALSEARASVIEGGGNPESESIHFVEETVRGLLRKSGSIALGDTKFDFIYTMGLFDYLTIPVARALVHRLHSIANPNSILMVGNYTVESPDRAYMDYIMDWPLLYKSPEEMLSLANGLAKETERSIGYEESGVQMFLKLVKKK